MQPVGVFRHLSQRSAREGRRLEGLPDVRELGPGPEAHGYKGIHAVPLVTGENWSVRGPERRFAKNYIHILAGKLRNEIDTFRVRGELFPPHQTTRRQEVDEY